MRPIVNDLLKLWEVGMLVKTPLHPNGRRIRVVLVCVVCDVPAAHKLGGFGSHSHTFFCTRCFVKLDDKQTMSALVKDGKAI
jgi:hypothetical protein